MAAQNPHKAAITRKWYHAHKGDAAYMRRVAQTNVRQKERRAMVAAIKLAAGCADCGYKAHPDVLQFDHVPERGTKLFQISTGMGRSWTSILAEIAKCDVVCANCHILRTAVRRGA